MKMWLVFVFLGFATARLSDDKCKEYYKEPSVRDDLIYEFPHMGLMGYDNGDVIYYRCPATLISESFALVGAFCFTAPEQNDPIYLSFGTSETKNKPFSDKDVNVTEILIHPKYSNIDRFSHALALVKFCPPITLSNTIRPGCLYTNNVDDKEILTDLLWINHFGDKPSLIKTFKQISSIVPTEDCKRNYLPGVVDEYSHLCVERKIAEEHIGHFGGASHVLENGIPKIVAIDNFGKQLPFTNEYPDVSTKLYNYLDWIEENVWKK